jgi:hypothetical protein
VLALYRVFYLPFSLFLCLCFSNFQSSSQFWRQKIKFFFENSGKTPTISLSCFWNLKFFPLMFSIWRHNIEYENNT